MSLLLAHKRLVFIVSILVYCLSLYYAYSSVAVKNFHYFGYGDGAPSFVDLVSIIIYGLIPAIIIPLNNARPSSYIVMIIYLIIYLPSLIIINDSGITLYIEKRALSFILFLSFIINVIATRIPLLNVSKIRLNLSLNVYDLVSAVAVLLFFVVVIYLSQNFSIIGLSDIYEKRDALHDIELGKAAYLPVWLSNFFAPILIARAIIKKRRLLLIFGFVIYLFLFFTIGAKLYLLAPGYFVLSYLYLKYLPTKFPVLPILFSGMLLFPIIIHLSQLQDLAFLYEGIISMRVFLVQGLSPLIYSDYFFNHEFTYFSHVSVINEFVTYPYNQKIPLVLDDYYGLGNFNAPYYVSDGLASAGYIGMLSMALVFSSFFYIFDCLAKGHDGKMVILSISVFVVSLSNSSLPTSITTFGGAFFVILFLFSSHERTKI
ncbi:hypothetical protein [Kangiella sp.]|uniref:hypothetical protein n=1 Tax=Kangiella sp. TaxID=1920245 RepID=UPI0019889941|nr:hypothetical protein [Kangiella sp.]MBD3652398.1 hypothetical protein [Kangiella sp.]